MPLRRFAFLALALAATIAAAASPASAGPAPVVVELFTSQGCSSCPPADAYLGKLAGRADLVALSLHVDYWDYIGWQDPFASRRNTQRQRAYAQTLQRSYVYTPQMVIQGRYDVRGNDMAAVEKAIDAARASPGLAVEIEDRGDGAVVVRVPAADFQGRATVWLAGYDRQHTTPVHRGENANKTLTNYNVVRVLTPVGTWTGAAMEIPVSLAGMTEKAVDGCAVIVQPDGMGPILGAAALELAPEPKPRNRR